MILGTCWSSQSRGADSWSRVTQRGEKLTAVAHCLLFNRSIRAFES